MNQICDRSTLSGFSNEQLNQNYRAAENLSHSMFSPGENRIFRGERLLQDAISERDPGHQDRLIREALYVLNEEPNKVDLDVVVPLLI